MRADRHIPYSGNKVTIPLNKDTDRRITVSSFTTNCDVITYYSDLGKIMARIYIDNKGIISNDSWFDTTTTAIAGEARNAVVAQ